MMTATIPITHRDLLTGPYHGVLSTMMPNGQPQSSIVWVDYDGRYILLNTTLERQKGQNMKDNPLVALVVIDPADSSRWIAVRGLVAEMTTDGAEAHADKLAWRYDGKRHFYGDVLPVEQKYNETRVIVKIEPVRVNCDAVFSEKEKAVAHPV